MKKTIVKKTYEVEQLDLFNNWEIYECPHCGGEGGIRDYVDGTFEDCDECGGSGELALYEFNDKTC